MQSPLRASGLAALTVCLASFGVMTTLWYALPQDSSIPGHWDYASGTLGDALVLPLLAAALTYLLVILGAGQRDWLAGLVGGMVGLAGGAAVQFSWLADPVPRLNWVLPEPGAFSAPGWYHAVLLVLLSGAIGAAYSMVLMRFARTSSADVVRQSRWAIALLSGAVTVFMFMVILDSTPSASTTSSTTTIAVCAASIAATVLPLFLAAGRHRALLLPAQATCLAIGALCDALLTALWPR